MRRAKDGQASRLAAVEQFLRHQARFDGLADAHVVGDQQPYGVELQGHQQRHKLVGPRFAGDLGEAAKRAGTGTETEANGIAKQTAGLIVAELVRTWQVELGLIYLFEWQVNTRGLVIRAAERSQHEQLTFGLGQYNPLAVPRPDE